MGLWVMCGAGPVGWGVFMGSGLLWGGGLLWGQVALWGEGSCGVGVLWGGVPMGWGFYGVGVLWGPYGVGSLWGGGSCRMEGASSEGRGLRGGRGL